MACYLTWVTKKKGFWFNNVFLLCNYDGCDNIDSGDGGGIDSDDNDYVGDDDRGDGIGGNKKCNCQMGVHPKRVLRFLLLVPKFLFDWSWFLNYFSVLFLVSIV